MHLCYLSDCEQHRKRRQELSLSTAHYEEATPCPAFPCAQILQFVLTSTETIADLQILADGLVERYEKAGQPPLSCMQTDCCCSQGPSKFQQLFCRWSDLQVRLGIWHFMWRFAVGCNEYRTFMAQLNSCMHTYSSGMLETLISSWLPREVR